MIRLCARLALTEAGAVVATASRLGVWGVGLPLPSDRQAATVLGERLRAAGIQLVEFGAPHNLATPDAVLQGRAAAGLRAALAVAAAAGALAVVTGPGHAAPGRGEEARVPHPDNLSEAALDRLAATCRQALAGAPAGVRLLLEPAVLSPVSNLTRAAEAVRRVAHPAFGIAFSPAQLASLDNFYDNDSYLRRAVQQLGPAIGAVHARDVLLHPDGFSYRLSEEPVGRGGLDYAALLDALRAVEGDVPVVVEHAGEAAVAQGLDHLRQICAQRGIRA